MSKWLRHLSNKGGTPSKSSQKPNKKHTNYDDINKLNAMDEDDHNEDDQYHYSQHISSYNTTSSALTKSGNKLYVGDKILLANKLSGKVISLGPKPDKDGIWVRVVMDDAQMTSDDYYNNNNRSNKSKTICVPIQHVDKIIKPGKKFDLTIDDRVIERKKSISGTVKYVGPTHFDKGVWFGVALDTAKGKNNGTVKKKFYFLSEPNHGVMLPYKRLEHENKTKKKRKGKGRSHSNGFDKNVRNDKEKNVLNRNHSNHQKTQSDGVVNKGYLAQQLQLEQHIISREQQQQQQQQILEEMNNRQHNTYIEDHHHHH
eukprot:197148_1